MLTFLIVYFTPGLLPHPTALPSLPLLVYEPVDDAVNVCNRLAYGIPCTVEKDLVEELNWEDINEELGT